MVLSEDLLRRIDADFAEGERSAAVSALDAYGEAPHEREVERVRRDILLLAKGDLREVHALVGRAKRDCRDVLFWAEYPQESRLDTPEKVASFNEMCRKFGASVRVPTPGEGNSGA